MIGGFVCGSNGADGVLLTDADRARDDQFCCMQAIDWGPESCICWQAEYDHDQTPDLALADSQGVAAERCHDCAFRPGSPEFSDPDTRRNLVNAAAAGRTPFTCHQGMRRVIAWRHPDGRVRPAAPGDYNPPVRDGVAFRTDGTPADICAGWAEIATDPRHADPRVDS